MIKTQINTYEGVSAATDVNRLPTSMRVSAAERKYAEAVAMYAATQLTMRQVAEKCGVTAAGLSSHIRMHHRALLLARYGLDASDAAVQSLPVKPPKGQSQLTYLKYKDAIEACGDVAYIEYNVSQVARMFGLSSPALAAQLRAHYPDVIPAREKLRKRLGIADNANRGARQRCKEAYAEAAEVYAGTDLSIAEVAERCGVSKAGLGQYLRFYRKDVVDAKRARRKQARKAVGDRRPGALAGNGSIYGPKPATVAMYAPALELYRTTPLTIKEIAERTGVPMSGFKGYLHLWHRSEKRSAGNAPASITG